MAGLEKLVEYGWMGIVLAAVLAFLLRLFMSQTAGMIKTIEVKDDEIKRLNDLRAETGEALAGAMVANENAMVEFRRVLADHTETIRTNTETIRALKIKVGE